MKRNPAGVELSIGPLRPAAGRSSSSASESQVSRSQKERVARGDRISSPTGDDGEVWFISVANFAESSLMNDT